MDYKYIEQLVERYFACETTLQEEEILRSFFSQKNVPVHLLQYADIFRYEVDAARQVLGSDFDEKMLALVHQETEKQTTSRVISMRNRFAPLFKAAAIVAMILTIGGAAEKAISNESHSESEGATAINPYIKKENISAAIKVKDNTQAETKTVIGADSLVIDN